MGKKTVWLALTGIIYIFLVVLCYIASPSIMIFLICFVLINLYYSFIYTQSEEGPKKKIKFVVVSIITAFTVNWLLGSPINIVIVIITLVSAAYIEHLEDNKKTTEQ